MLLIKNTERDPYFNLAAEEYLLEESSGDVLMLWRNDKAVIIGKNQNAFAEVNIPFVLENEIKTVRRLTGGGAVFHDAGNVNFTFITDTEKGAELNFTRFEAPVVQALLKMGVDASLDGRNDIIADGCKISGNAQCVYNTADGRRRLMHHGTLLFSADMSYMSGALNVSDDKLRAKGIKSVRQRVANIASLPNYSGPRDVDGFIDALAAELTDGEPVAFLSDEQRQAISALANTKYSTWEWNFGASPSYELTKSRRFSFGSVEITLSAEKGRIKAIDIRGDFFGSADIAELCRSLLNTKLEKESLAAALCNVGEYIRGADADSIAALILNG